MDAFDLTEEKTVAGRFLFRPAVLFLAGPKNVASRGPS
jgi:hypothetical protein